MAPPVQTVSVQEFANLIGKTSQRVYQLLPKGLPHRKRGGHTKIVPSEAIKWYIEYQTWEFQQQRKRTDIPDEEEERALKMRAERQMKELELMERAKDLVPAADLNEFVERVFGGFAAVVHGRLQRFERDIVRANTPPDARKLVERMQAAMMNGARAYADQLDDEAAELEHEAAIAANPRADDDESEEAEGDEK